MEGKDKHAGPVAGSGGGRQALRDKADELEQLFANINILLAHLDRDFNFIRVNRAYAAADGRDPGFFPGRNHFALYPNPDNEAIFRQVVESGETFTTFARPFVYAEHPERGVSYWDWSLVPLKGPVGQVEALLLALIDVTERVVAAQQLRERLADLGRRAGQMRRAEELARLGYWRDDLITGELSWSDGAFRLLGLEPGSVAPTLNDFLRHVHPDDRERIGRAKAAAEERHGLFEEEFRVVRADDGEERVLHAKAATETDADGNAVSLFGATLDVTESRRAEAMLSERFRLMAENIRDLFWVRDTHTGTVVYANPAYERIWGRSRSSLYRNPDTYFEAIHPDDRERVAAGLAAFAQGEWSAEYRVVRPDGSVRRIADRGFALVSATGACDLVVGTATDVTELREATDELRRKNRKLERINQELQAFAYVASHDLKAPLRAVYGLTDWLEEEVAGHLSAEGQQRMQLLRERVRHMDDLINGLLDYSRAGGNSGNLETLSVAELVASIATTYGVPDSFSVSTDPDLPLLHTDRLHLHQVFENLIGNAVKYHDRPDGHVHVSARDLGDFYEFAVADDGPGIPPDYHRRIFDIFQRGPQTARNGTGIGLAVVKKVVEHAGGRVSLESAPGRGSTFRFTWPKVMSAEAPEPF